jgi:hypothetical protein
VFFRMSYVTRDFYYGNNEIKISNPTKKIEIVLRKRPEGTEPPAIENNDGLIVATCERELPERLQRETEASGALSIKKQAVREVFDDFQDCIVRTLRLLRWRTASEGTPNPIRMETTNYFVWSLDGADWKLVADSIHHATGFEIRQLGSSPTKEDIEFIQKGLIEGLNEPLGHELLREAVGNRQSNPRSALILAVAAAEVDSSTLLQNDCRILLGCSNFHRHQWSRCLLTFRGRK